MAFIADLIARDRLETLFQPIVELGSGELVGYEALTRGPAGTPLESPLAVLAAARAEGQLAELDWTRRKAAVRRALAAGLRRPGTLFLNAESAALNTSCPPSCAALMARAHAEFNIVVEVTERALADRPAELLRGLERVREAGWGIALDDVGVVPQSLALIPLARPEVVKLDRSVLRAPAAHTARMVAAVGDYVRESGARLLVEGIETPEDAARGTGLGATLGQGYYFGRPAPMRPSVTVGPGVPLPAPQPPLVDETPWEIASRSLSARVARKAELIPISRRLERDALRIGEPSVVLGTFQDARYFTAASRRRFDELGLISAFVGAFGAGMPERPLTGVRGADLAVGDRLRAEWDLVVLGPHYAGALFSRDLGDGGAESDRRFLFAQTEQRQLVVRAARSLMLRMAPLDPSGHPAVALAEAAAARLASVARAALI